MNLPTPLTSLTLWLLAIVLCGFAGCSQPAQPKSVKVAKQDGPKGEQTKEPEQPAEEEPQEVAEPEVTEPPSLFSRQHLLYVDIKIAEKAWAALCGQTRTMASALSLEQQTKPFSYFRADVTVNGTAFKSVAIRKKGFIGSLDEERPSLKIKFNHFKSKEKRTFEGVDRLTLNNNKQDRSLASQYLAYDLFRKAGLPAPRCNLAVVSVNGKKLGIYSNVESVKADFQKKNFGPSRGAIYEGTLADFFHDRIHRFEAKTNKTWAKEIGIKKLHKLAETLDPSKELSLSAIEKLVDVPKFLTYWSLESLIGFWDGYSGNQNNFFVYFSDKNPKIQFVPWGIDAAFTNRRFGRQRNNYKSVFAKGLLANRLNTVEEIREQYHEAMEWIFGTIWDEKTLLKDTDRIEWLVKDDLHPRQERFLESLNRVRTFIKNRRDEIWAEVEEGPIFVNGAVQYPAHTVAVGTIKGTFQTKWRGNRWEPIPQSGRNTATGLHHDKKFSLRQLTAIAHTGRARRWNRGAQNPTIVFRGTRSDNGRQVTLTLVIPSPSFHSGRTVKVHGRFGGENNRFWGSGMVDGKITLNQVSREGGGPVAGKFEVRVFEMRR